MSESKYSTFEEFVSAVKAGLHPNYVFTVDNDCCYAWEPHPTDEWDSVDLFRFGSCADVLLIEHVMPMLGLRAESA